MKFRVFTSVKTYIPLVSGRYFFFQVNRIAYTVPKPVKNGGHLQENRTRIIFTHLPLLFTPSAFVQQVLSEHIYQLF
jgi:hypothetical protein